MGNILLILRTIIDELVHCLNRFILLSLFSNSIITIAQLQGRQLVHLCFCFINIVSPRIVIH